MKSLHAENVDIAQRRPIIPWIERGVLLLSICYLCFHAMPRAWNGLVTDFPNYYMSARLAHERYDTSRMYEWTWLQREKDHRAVDIHVIGLLPITPFSTLAMWPLTGLEPLTAKRIWILLNLALLVPIGWMLRSMTRLTYRQIALVFALSIPLQRNLEFGQFYVVLLLLIVAACWAYLRGYLALAGVLVAIAAACKIFPALLLVLFLQRRHWRVLAWGAIAGIAATGLSIAVFGWNVHRTYLLEILPWTLHGEAMPPYLLNASISGVLHRLFLFEPQWNPRPWHSSPLCYSLLLPALQMFILAPAILLIRRGDDNPNRKLLEWAALLTASLAISTDPASYNFVLMAFPMCVIMVVLLQGQRYGWLIGLWIAYLGIGFPVPSPHHPVGLGILLYVPRLFLMLCVLAGIYGLLARDHSPEARTLDWARYAWMLAMTTSVIVSATATLHRERAVRREYEYRLPLKVQGFLNAGPRADARGIHYISFTLDGYHLMTAGKNAESADPPGVFSADDLSFTSGLGRTLVEIGSAPDSQIADVSRLSRVVISNAREPMLSADGQSCAYIRDDHGRGRFMMRRAYQSAAASTVALTPASLNVYEGSFLSERDFAFSAVQGSHPPEIFLTDPTHSETPLGLHDSRYPALSPDGHWMAYSHFAHGAWNLWVRDQRTGATRQIDDVPCNQIQPSWENDSKTLLYSTDCGRSLWFTSVSRRRVIP